MPLPILDLTPKPVPDGNTPAPAAPARASAATAGAPYGTPTARVQMQKSEKADILLVDDEPSKLAAHDLILSELGENIVKAASGQEALQILLRQEFAVILLDIKLPDMDGFEIAEIIRHRPSLERTPIIFLTAYSTSDLDRIRGYGIGAADYLFLPVPPEILKAKVRVFVELAKQKQIIRKQAEFLSWHNQQQEQQIRTIQELNARLLAANEDLESFSYTISHDLRSPLRALQGFSEILLEEFRGKLGSEAEDYLSRINRAAHRMDHLIRDVLAYSRIAKAGLDLQPIDLERMLGELLGQHSSLPLSKARVSVKQPLHPVVGHEASLAQCLSNVIDNGLKFMAEGVTPEIQIWTETHDCWVRISVADNGVGIDSAFHGRIFKIFERVDPQQKYEGTGIGLAIVKKAIERMGGRVGVESSPGRGSRFWIELPATPST